MTYVPKIFQQVLFALTLLSVVLLVTNVLPEGGFSPTSDEGYYFKYAQQVSVEGIQAFPKLIREYFQSTHAQWYPPPTRIGYILTAAALFKINPTFMMLGLISLLSFLAALIVNYFFTKKYLGQFFALACTALLASSPLLMAMSRRALTDSTINVLWCLACWLFIDYLCDRKQRTFLYFLATYIVCLLFKESAVLLLPVWIVMGWCISWQGKTRLNLRDGCWLVGAFVMGLWIIPGCVVGFALWTDVVMKIFFLQQKVFHINPYVTKYCQGPWFRYILDAFLLIPLAVIGAVAFVGTWLNRNVKTHVIYYQWGLIYVLISILMIPLQKNIRYVISFETIYALFTVGFLFLLFDQYRRKNILIVCAMMILVVINWKAFLVIFLNGRLLDPITNHLLVFRGFIPVN